MRSERERSTDASLAGLVPVFTAILLFACLASIKSAESSRATFPAIPLIGNNAFALAAKFTALGGVAVMACGWLAFLSAPYFRKLEAVALPSLAYGAIFGLMSLFLIDQHWLQPWAWQALLIFLIDRAFNKTCELKNTRRKRRWWMRLACSVYFFSAVSKLDLAFIDHLGRLLVMDGLVPAVGLNAAFWSESFQRTVIALLPVVELLAAVCLWFVRLRHIGIALATSVHVGLLITLGPLGLDHHAGVLIWNVYFLASIWILFWRCNDSLGRQAGDLDPPVADPTLAGSLTPSLRKRQIAATLVLLLPAAEPFGYFDHWPGWSVYSNRSPVIRVEIAFPRVIENVEWISDPQPLSDLQVVSLSGWSFDAWRTPVYPQERFQLAVVNALLEKLPADTQFRVTVLSYAPDRTGRARESQYTTRNDLRSRLQDFWLPTTATAWELPSPIAETIGEPQTSQSPASRLE